MHDRRGFLVGVLILKTPEQLAGAYASKQHSDTHCKVSYGHKSARRGGVYTSIEQAFLAGYRAAKAQLDTGIASRDAWKEDAERYAENADYWKAQAAAPQWISVKDRLPERGESYLVLKDDGTSPYQLAIVWFDRTWDFPNADEVTHWMPLPEPPEDK